MLGGDAEPILCETLDRRDDVEPAYARTSWSTVTIRTFAEIGAPEETVVLLDLLMAILVEEDDLCQRRSQSGTVAVGMAKMGHAREAIAALMAVGHEDRPDPGATALARPAEAIGPD